MIPTLETERLVLGPCSQAHLAAFEDFCATDRARWFGGPCGPDEAWRGVAMQLGHWDLRGYGQFWVSEAATGRPVGRTGIWNPAGWPEPELAWLVYADFEGKGYASEAARAARDWAWRARGLGPLISLIAPDNARSIALAERIGARFEADGTYPSGDPCKVYRHPLPDAAGAAG